MATLKTAEIERTLLQLGFQRKAKGDHVRYYLWVEGRKSQIRTMVSHGEREIGDHLISLMARQLRVSKIEFLALIEGGLDGDWYLAELRRKGLLGPGRP